MGFPKIKGTISNTDYSILGSPYFGNYLLFGEIMSSLGYILTPKPKPLKSLNPKPLKA